MSASRNAVPPVLGMVKKPDIRTNFHRYPHVYWDPHKYLAVEWVQNCLQLWDERLWPSKEMWAQEAFTTGEGKPEMLLSSKVRPCLYRVPKYLLCL